MATCLWHHSIISSGAQALWAGGQLGLPARAPIRLVYLGWRASLQWQAGATP